MFNTMKPSKRHFLRQIAHALSTSRREHLSASQSRSVAHLINEPIEEELLPGNLLKYFHPTRPGATLNKQFKTICKLGSGAGSTVWLAENLKYKWWRRSQLPRYVTIKIAVAVINGNESREARYSKIIADANPSHEGLSFIRVPIDKFQLEGPMGKHQCLVYHPMRETIYELQHSLRRNKIEPPLFKLYIYCLLQALDYLHTECRLIHTDIKDDNIMVTLEDDGVLADFVSYQKKNPQPKHVRKEDGRETYLSQRDFGRLRGSRLLPRLSDFDQCFPGLKDTVNHLSPIQSHCYRAPEVLLGCGWSYGVDIWNTGLLMWNLLEDADLFERPAGDDGKYDAHVHLAHMVSLLGHPPKELIQREKRARNVQLGCSVWNFRGEEVKTMNEFWGGPFFDDDDQIMRKSLIKDERKLADTVTELTGDEKEAFLELASCMLQWLPEKRSTAKELLQHRFFDELNESRRRYMEEDE